MANKVVDNITSLGDFIGYINDEYEYLKIYRGQSEDKPLIPKLGRIDLKDELLESEKNMLGIFKEQSIPFLPRVPSSTRDWLALAQHHGLPTRLLDWTSNPLIALWFSVEVPSRNDNPGVVWMFKTQASDFALDDFDLESIKLTKIFRPPHIVARIKAQSGYFTAHAVLKSGGFLQFQNHKRYKDRLTKIVIPANKFSNFRHDLDIIGINRAFIYSDIDGLAQHIGWLHQRLGDEKEARRKNVPVADESKAGR
jgi:FRG domain